MLRGCISNLFPRFCYASLGPAFLSDGHLQYPYLLVQLRSCAKRAFGSIAGYLQLLLTATWKANMRRVSVSEATALNSRCNRRGGAGESSCINSAMSIGEP